MEPAPPFAEVFASMREKVFALSLHVTGNRHDAQDATQETFLSVHRALPSFRGEAQVSTWVYRIALRSALQVRARRRPTEALEADAMVSEHPEQALAARDEGRRLAAAMEHLSGDQRAVLSLFAVDGLTHPQIAAVLGVPEGTVWSRLHAARKRLRVALGEA